MGAPYKPGNGLRDTYAIEGTCHGPHGMDGNGGTGRTVRGLGAKTDDDGRPSEPSRTRATCGNGREHTAVPACSGFAAVWRVRKSRQNGRFHGREFRLRQNTRQRARNRWRTLGRATWDTYAVFTTVDGPANEGSRSHPAVIGATSQTGIPAGRQQRAQTISADTDEHETGCQDSGEPRLRRARDGGCRPRHSPPTKSTPSVPRSMPSSSSSEPA